MVRHHEPLSAQLFVHVGDDPIDLPSCAVFHLCLTSLDADFPGKIAVYVDMVNDQRDRPL
jgi:hypothetical protein